MTDQTPPVEPLTPEEERALDVALGLAESSASPTVTILTPLLRKLLAERRQPVSPDLRTLFTRYIESHGEPDEWDTDDGWCMKHLPTIVEARTALAQSTDGERTDLGEQS